MKKIINLLPVLYILLINAPCIHAQNVGIGTTSPSEKLHVAGNLKTDTVKPNAIMITGDAGEGKVLTSDANGNGSWRAASTGSSSIGFGVWGDCATNANISEYNPVADTTGATNDFFGRSVAISGSFAIVGSPNDDIGGNNDQGSASIYQFNGTTWEFFQRITDPAGAASDLFGFSVAISGNFAMVGAYLDDNSFVDQGGVCFFQFNGTSWVFMQKVFAALANERFGYSVSISGNLAAVGAPDRTINAARQGAVHPYRFNGTSWVATGAFADNGGTGDDNFGRSVSVSGTNLIIGAPGDEIGIPLSYRGSASIYRWNGSAWVFGQKLTDAGGASSDSMGKSVSISGNYAVIGIPDDDAPAAAQGSVVVFRFNGSTWVQMQKITDPAGLANDGFGSAVSISGDYIIAGSPAADINGNANRGSAAIFVRFGNSWGKMQSITDPMGAAADAFGGAVALDPGKRFLIGATGFNSSMGRVSFGKIN